MCYISKSESLSKDQIARKRQHVENKESARKLKSQAKEKSLRNSENVSYAFGMQQLLPCPKSNCPSFFYKRKFYVQNLTVYNLGTSDVICLMWPGFEAKRGLNEVAACLSKYIEKKAVSGCKTIDMFSNKCPVQNKNQFVAHMLDFMNSRLGLDKLLHWFRKVTERPKTIQCIV